VSRGGDLVNLVPGLGEIQQAGANRNYYLRGIGTADFHLTAASSIGQSTDDISLTSGFHALTSVFDLERVEVIRGPQNTLFGLNTTGGSIAYISRKPSIGAGTNGYADITVGSDSKLGVDAAVGFDLSDKVSTRLALHTDKYDGPFISDTNGVDYGNEDLTAVRGSLLWQLSDQTELLFNLHGANSDNNGTVVKAVGTRAPDGSGDRCADYNPSQVINFERRTDCVTRNGRNNGQAASNPSRDDWETVAQNFGSEDISTQGLFAKLSHNLGWASLDLIAAADNLDYETAIDADGSATTLLHLTQADDRDTRQFEARLTSADSERLRWIGGAYYLDEEADSFTGVVSPAIGGGARLPNTQLDHSREVFGLYGQGEYDLSDSLTFTGGFRWSSEDLAGSYLPSAPNALGLISSFMPIFADSVDQLVAEQFIGRPGFDENGFQIARQVQRSQSNQDLGYTAKLDWSPAPGRLLYFSNSKGFKGSALDIRAAFSLVPVRNLQADIDENQFDPESVLAWELGYKASFWDNRLQFDAAAFHYIYDDLQQFITAGGVPTLDNADQAKVSGFDGNIRYADESGLSLNMGFALLDSEITDIGDSQRFIVGAELANSPSFSGFISASKRLSLGNGNTLTLSSNVSHTGDARKAVLLNATDRTGNIRTQPSFTLLNANASYRFGIDNKYSLTVSGDNLTNERFCGSRGVNEANRTFNDGISNRDISHAVTCRTTRASTRTFSVSFGVDF